MSIIYGEIKDQYSAFSKCARYIDEKFEAIKDVFAQANRIVYIGCGSSYSLAKSMSVATCMGLNLPSIAIAAGDLLIHAAGYADFLHGALIVPLSRSGSTSEVLMALEALRKCNCAFTVLSISCVSDCALSKSADLSLEMPWCFDNSVCQTRTVSCLYYSGMYILARLCGDAKLEQELQELVQFGAAFCEKYEPSLKEIAQANWTHGIVLGDAQIQGIAEEGSLAFKEICQLPSNFYNILDFRHGPIVLANAQTLVIAALSGSALENALIADVVKRGAQVLVYSDLPVEIEGVTNLCLGKSVSHTPRGLLLIVLCQLATYYKSFATGADPDQPDGLDAWIQL